MCFHIFSPENITWALAWSPWFSHCRLFHQEPPFVPPKWYIFRLWRRKKLFLQITLLVQLPNLFLVQFIVIFASISINFFTDAPYVCVSESSTSLCYISLFSGCWIIAYGRHGICPKFYNAGYSGYNFYTVNFTKHKKWVKMEKFTPLAKILRCRRQWRQGQISTLA